MGSDERELDDWQQALLCVCVYLHACACVGAVSNWYVVTKVLGFQPKVTNGSLLGLASCNIMLP